VSASWRLSLAFDVNPSRLRGVIDSRAISGTDDPADRRLEHLLQVASTFQLTDAAARRIITRFAVAVSNWEAVATRLELDEWQRAGYRETFSSPQLGWALSLDDSLR
jgi:serine/threonine-protein kinase HipA